MSEAMVRIGGRLDPIRVNFDGPRRTFELETDLVRAACRAELDPLNIDLLEIAATVFAADSAVKRGGATRPGMGAAWQRTFDFQIPVRNPVFWNRDDVRQALVEAVEFLTEDRVSFTFYQKPADVARQPFLDLDPAGATFEADEVILFSGGLDSFAGALEALSGHTKRVILLTHRSAQKAITRQVKLGEYLAERFCDHVLHIHVKARRVGQEASDSSQRSRSFLFAALGQLVARSFGAKSLSFYENGVISHNLPISSQVVGTMATRTTHPLSLRKLNALMSLVGTGNVPIANQYRWLTKRDVVDRIAQYGGERKISKSVSCTSIREQTTHHTHCGTCSQCLDRRFALLAAGLGQHDFDTDYGTDILFGARDKLRSQTMAVEWTRHALSLTRLDQRTFMTKFGTEFARIAEGYPGQSKQWVLDQCVTMHKRHGENVERVLEQVLRDRTLEILHGKLPSTSLVVLFLAQPGSGDSTVLTAPEPAKSRISETEILDKTDLVHDPDAPLRVTFTDEDGLPVVRIEGLCVLTGPQARVPIELRPTFLEDRDSILPPEEHRYVPAGTLAASQGVSKMAIRQQVTRCRQILDESYRMVHGKELEEDRFIQTRTPKGYRLAPTIIPVREDES